MNASAPFLRRPLIRVALAVLFITALPATALTLRAQGSAVRIESFTLQPDGEVRVTNSRGSTRVEAWGSSSVRIVAEKKSPAGSAIGPMELVMMGAGNSVIVECRETNQDGRIDLTLYVPRQSHLQIAGGSYPVDVSGSFLGATIDTTSGAIGYRVPASDDATIDARTPGGIVRSTIALADAEREGNQSLRGRLGNGDSEIFLISQSGAITLSPGPTSGRATHQTASSRAAGETGAAPSQPVERIESQDRGRDQESSPDTTMTTSAPPNGGSQAVGSYQRSQSGGGSVDFAGSDSGIDGSSASRSGPLERHGQQRSTGGGNMGLRTRIIPSDSPPIASRNGTTATAPDQDDNNQSQSGSGANSTAGRQSQPPDPAASSNGSGSVFAGSDIGDDSTSSSRGGPFERDRKSRNTGGGSSGLRIRIIPSGDPQPRVETIPFPPQGQSQIDSYSPPRQTMTSLAPSSRSGGASQSSQYSEPENNNSPQPPRPGAAVAPRPARSTPSPSIWNDVDPEPRANSRRVAPPTLGRSGSASEPPTTGEPEPERASSNAEDEAITLKAALVNLNVSVTNRAGMALGNLKKDDFQVSENGQPQKIEFFAPSTAPFNLVLLVDLSGSIKDKLDVIKSAALKFLDVLGPQDKVAVVCFTDEIRVVSQLTSDRDELKRRIRSIERPQGGTAFYEAMWFSLLDTLRGTQGQRNAIVVLSDGVDSSMDRYNPMDSRVSFPQLARRLEESDVIVFPIYFDTEYEEVFERGNSSSEAYATARDQLQRIAELSGGQMFKAEKASDLSGVYKQVAAAIRTVYSIGYQPTNAEKDGTFRRIRVSVNNVDAAVKTRKGYYAK